MCTPSQTKYGVFTFYSPPSLPFIATSLRRLLIFSCFSNLTAYQHTTPFCSGVDSNESSNVFSWFIGFVKFSQSFKFHVNTFCGFGVVANLAYTAQKMNFSIKDFSSKCDQMHSFHGLIRFTEEIYLMENCIFCAVCTKPTTGFWTLVSPCTHMYAFELSPPLGTIRT